MPRILRLNDQGQWVPVSRNALAAFTEWARMLKAHPITKGAE